MGKYDQVIEKVFFDNYIEGAVIISFTREELAKACSDLGFERIRNLGDIPYTYRFRRELPRSIKEKCPNNSDWIIIGTGVGTYEFKLAAPAKIQPSDNRQKIKILDSTPEIVKKYAPGTDEQALLTQVRYNRLIDLFTGLTCYSIQNHLRTTVSNLGQIEIDEIYIGVNRKGSHFVIPCQAKSPGDKFGIVQIMQDMQFCRERYPNATCKPIALQFLSENDVAILELTVEEDNILKLLVIDEKHYTLVLRPDISEQDILRYRDLEDL